MAKADVDAIVTAWTEGAKDPPPVYAPLAPTAFAGLCVHCGQAHCFCADYAARRSSRFASSNAGDLLANMSPMELGAFVDWHQVQGMGGPEVATFQRELEQRYGKPLKQLLAQMETWISRKMGRAFDPERHCPYTGSRLWQFPFAWDVRQDRPLMGYYRESDGWMLRCRLMTAEERAWIEGNPEAWERELAEFRAWLGTVDEIPF